MNKPTILSPEQDMHALAIGATPPTAQASPLAAKDWTMQAHQLATSGKAAWACRAFDPDAIEGGCWGDWRLTTYEPPRQPDQWFEVLMLPATSAAQAAPVAVDCVSKEWVVKNPGAAAHMIHVLAKQIDGTPPSAAPVEPSTDTLEAAFANTLRLMLQDVSPEGIRAGLFTLRLRIDGINSPSAPKGEGS